MPEVEATKAEPVKDEAAEEEKKRKKKEDAKAFFEAKKKQKLEEKKKAQEEKAAAIARGETVPEPPKPPPLEDPPLLTPHVRNLYNAFWDAKTPPDGVREAVKALIDTRRRILEETAVIEGRDDLTIPMRRKALVRVVADRLNCAQGQAAVAQLAADPLIQALRKNVSKSLKQFFDQHKDWFAFQDITNKHGKPQQMVYINTGVTSSQAPMTKENMEKRTAKLLWRIGEMLDEAENKKLPISKLGGDAQVRQFRKGLPGAAASLSAFLKKNESFFTVEEVETPVGDPAADPPKTQKEIWCLLVAKPPEPAPEEEETPEKKEENQALPPWMAHMQAAMEEWCQSWDGAEGVDGGDGEGEADPEALAAEALAGMTEAIMEE